MGGWRNRKVAIGVAILAVGFVLAVAALAHRGSVSAAFRRLFRKDATVSARVEEIGPGARARLLPLFKAAGVSYPPGRVVLAGLKEERRLELHAGPAGARPRFVRSYPILAASGGPGPKLREGDRQVPEGLYRIESLNPNSRFHVALRVGYPGPEDRRRAQEDGRSNLGGDIMIHGGAASIGCLAMGDPAAEELFVLAADAGLDRIEVVLAPCDLRQKPPPAARDDLPSWTPALWGELAGSLAGLESAW